MFEVIAWNGRDEVVVDVFAERGNAEQFARELDAKVPAHVYISYFVRRRLAADDRR